MKNRLTSTSGEHYVHPIWMNSELGITCAAGAAWIYVRVDNVVEPICPVGPWSQKHLEAAKQLWEELTGEDCEGIGM